MDPPSMGLGPAEALFNALDNGNMMEVNEELDKYPEGVNARDDEQRLPLHYAADCADLETFHLNSSVLDAQDANGFTPLLVSVMAGNVDILEFLIERGAQVSHLDRDKHSAVHWAVVCGQGAHALHYAMVMDDVSVERAETILYVLLKYGAYVNSTDSDGRTPILWASSNGNVDAFKSLVQAGANKSAVDRDKLGVLHCAACHGHLEIIRAMLDLSEKSVDRNGDTALFYAATFGHYECAKLLLERGADPNHLDKRIRSAAHCAAAKGQLRVMELLQQYGASLELQNYRGDLPFHEAVQMGSQGLVEWLLIVEPKFVSAPNFYGRTPLHLAAASGNMELVVLLCNRLGGDINPLMLYKDELYTPLDLAKRRGHELVVEYLTQRHEALTATEISQDKRNHSRNSIEEQLKTAKLRRIRAQAASSGDSDSDTYEKRYVRTSKGVLKIIRRGKSVQSGLMKGRQLVDAETSMTSRRSSSASGAEKRRPGRAKPLPSKSTSTTDLTRQNAVFAAVANLHTEMTRADGSNPEGVAEVVRKVSDRLAQIDLPAGIERDLVEETIQKIVKEELRKMPNDSTTAHQRKENGSPDMQRNNTNAKSGNRHDVTTEHSRITWKKEPPSQHQDEGSDESNNMPNGQKANGGTATSSKQKSAPGSGQKKKVQLVAEEIIEPSASNLSSYFMDKDRDQLPLTELHIIEDGWEPLYGRLAMADSVAERRYVHEKAIFEELTHLKRMQIQYGKVQERVLVRSLINNFCRMHGLSPAHFRYTTFYEWEKFLYDQLKLIYLEERDRIQLTTANQAHLSQAIHSTSTLGHATVKSLGTNTHARFENRLHKAAPLDDRLRELTRIYSSSTTTSATRQAAAKQIRGSANSRSSYVNGEGSFVNGRSSKNGNGEKTNGGGGKRFILVYNFIWKRMKLPPGPAPLPIIGNKLSLRGADQTYQSLIRWSKEYGPVYTYWIGEIPIVNVASYQLIKDTFIKEGDAFAGRDFFKDAYTICKPTNGLHGVVGTEGEQWRQLRRFSLQVLRNLGMGRNRMEEMILLEVETLLDTIDENLCKNVQEHDIISLVDLAVGSVLNQIIFGHRFLGESQEEFYMLKAILDEHIKAFDNIITNTVLMVPWMRHFPIFSQAFDRFERQKEDGAVDREPDYFVDAFLEEIEKSCGDRVKEHYFNIASLRGLCWDLYSAGQETTSNTLRFLILYMMLYPEIQRKMQEELVQSADDNNWIKYEDRLKFPYTNAVIYETQRCCNLLAQNLNHRTTRDVEIRGHKIRKHTLIVPQISCVLYDEEIFPNAKQFVPERFLDQSGQLKKFEEFIPFSVGKRICLGESMARMELFLFTANLFRRYKISVTHENNPPSAEQQAGLTMSTYACKSNRCPLPQILGEKYWSLWKVDHHSRAGGHLSIKLNQAEKLSVSTLSRSSDSETVKNGI
ncbi:cytochrome p450 domain-containing protein [Ditylenchus destructor]|nr:cytochrome p450 domain-containing protein [Ditylenchus destructor]